MRCAKVRQWINRSIDNDLDSIKAEALKSHLSSCSSCRKLHQDLQKIVAGARDLEDLSPRNGSWDRIKQAVKLKQTPARPMEGKSHSLSFMPGFRLAAAVMTLTLFAVGIILLGPRFINRNSDPLNLEEGRQFTLAKLKEAEEHYQKAIKALGEAAYSREAEMDPQVAEVLRVNLDLINISISACKQAVLADPENLESRNYLLAVYQEKANLLTRIINMNGGISKNGTNDSII